MQYLEFEHKIINFLKQQGWIKSYTSDRQDTYIEWSDLGKSKFTNFLNEVKSIYDLDTHENKLLRSFCIYHNIIQPTKKEYIISTIKSNTAIGGEFMVIICSKSGEKTSKNFQSINDESLYSFIEMAYDNDDEIIFIELSNMSTKFTPFGTKGFY